MKIIHCIVATALLSVSAGAQPFSTGFGDNPGDGVYNAMDGIDVADLAGQDGWQVNDATRRISFMATRAGSLAGGLGGLFDEPVEPTVTVRRNTDLPLAGARFRADFSISPSEFVPGQDIFGFSFSDDGASQLFNVSFEPQVIQDNVLRVRSSTLGDAAISSGYGVFLGGDYNISIDFIPAGLDDINFQVTLVGTNTESFGGLIPGAGASSIGSFGVFYQTLSNSDSYISFDNLALVPEPGSLMLLALSAVGLVLNRRR